VGLRELTWWVVAADAEKRYTRFEIERRAGGKRVINAPIKPLKEIQRRLADHLLAVYSPPAPVHGFVNGRSPVTNARAHRRQAWVLRVDIEDFFPSINFGRVRGMFMAFPFEYPPDVATLLAQICCHENQLPQGAPTSPIVSNYICRVCRGLDTQLSRLAAAEHCFYTRYADDICISTGRPRFPAKLGTVKGGDSAAGPALTGIVESNGFELNDDKTHLMRRTQRQRVTGMVVNSKVNVSRHYVRDLRNLLFIWRKHGEEDAINAWRGRTPVTNRPPGKPKSSFAQMVRGRVQHVGAVKGWTSSVYIGLASSLSEVDPSFQMKSRPPPAGTAPQEVRLFTEGKSDVLHMLAAQRYFHERGDFTDFKLIADESSFKEGGTKLLAYCEALAVSRQDTPCVCLFDRDDATVLKKAVGEADWKDWGKGVAAVALVGSGEERLCVEMLHDQTTREIEDDGRRMFLATEFDRRGFHTTRKYTTPYPKSEKLVPEYVYDIATTDSVLLGKTAFAKAIHDRLGTFANIEFEGFRVSFETIREAIRVAVAGTRSN
jgi:RNA-directed DNA polymerase